MAWSEPEQDLELLRRRVKRALFAEQGTIGKLEALSAVAKLMIRECDGAGFALEVRGTTRSIGTTDTVVLEADLVQYDTGEGPCLDAILNTNVVRIDVLEPDAQWRHFAPGALDLGIHSVLSLPVVANGTTVGALNLYSRSENAFDDVAEAVGTRLAGYAGEVITESSLYEASLDLADSVLEEVASREVINSAAGVLMAENGYDDIEALRELTDRAEDRATTLREAAEWELREQQFRESHRPRAGHPGDSDQPEQG